MGDYIYIPPATTLSMELDPDSFVPNVQEAALIYSPVTSYHILHGRNYSEVSQEDLDKMRTKLLHYDSLPVPELQKQLEELDYNYPEEPTFFKLANKAWENAPSLIKKVVIATACHTATLAGLIFIIYKFQLWKKAVQCICKQPEEQRATEDDEPRPSVPLRSEAVPRALKSVNALKALQKLSRKWSLSARPSTSKNDSFEDLEAEVRELQTLGKSKSSYCLFPGPTSADQPPEKEHPLASSSLSFTIPVKKLSSARKFTKEPEVPSAPPLPPTPKGRKVKVVIEPSRASKDTSHSPAGKKAARPTTLELHTVPFKP